MEELRELSQRVQPVPKDVENRAMKVFENGELRGEPGVQGGAAGKTGIVFVGDKVTVTTVDGSLWVRKSRNFPEGKLGKIPFIRGPIKLARNVLAAMNKRFLGIWVGLTLGIWVVFRMSGVDPSEPIKVPEGFKAGVGDKVLTVVLVLGIGILGWRIVRRVVRWHGAEHMAILWWDQYTEGGTEGIEEQGRFTSRCGSALATYLIVGEALLWMLPWEIPGMLGLLINVSVSYEIFEIMNNDGALGKVLFAPAWVLQHVVCWKPEKEMLEDAKRATIVLAYYEKCIEGRNSVGLDNGI